jgi:hypothetical protein
MPDFYTTITQAPSQVLAGLMTALELRSLSIRMRHPGIEFSE